ncbi:hypothetical protein LCGC14_2744200 [marine sediment metagenome]|uniref:Uncharacterized protein n=1 Tax=marine sediment metagenome TaxID=412755 RepID=A0A0F9BCG8_9ZZZZ
MQTRLIAVLILLVSACWADTEGPNSPTASANNSPAWTDPDNMHSQGTGNATGDFADDVDQITFGFSAVTGTVDGVTVEFDCHKTGTRNNVLRANLLNVGTCTLKNTGILTTTEDDAYNETLGSSSDTWSCTDLTAANVNNSAFGVSVLAQKSGGANPLTGTYLVDHVRITVDYTAAGGKRRVMTMVIGD